MLLLAIELLDELVGGSRAAAWPLIRHDLNLSYGEIGLALAIPGLVGSALDPVIGFAGDTSRRRALMVAGGIGFALSAVMSAGALGFWTLLVALAVGNPSSGAFVSLAQATLMDRGDRERNMARWTLAGSVGYVAGPILIAGALRVAVGWRGVLLALGLTALPLVLATRRLALPAGAGSERSRARDFVAALRRRDVLRWLALLEAADLMLDVFHGFLALYLVDVVHIDAAEAAVGVAVWTGAGLVGDLLLLPALHRIRGDVYLRASALAALAAYPAFLLVSSTDAKLVLLAVLGLLNSGWYALPKAGLYGALPGRSGTAVAVAGAGGLAGAAVPAALGLFAEAAGLGATMWILLLAPVALAAGVPRRSRPGP